MNPDLIDWIWRAAIGLVIGLILYGVKDWRRTKLENDLAADTNQPKARKVGIETLESQILTMAKAWDYERDSKNRQITDLEKQHEKCQERIDKAETLARETKDQAEILAKSAKDKMDAMANELEKFRKQLAQFTDIVAYPNDEEI